MDMKSLIDRLCMHECSGVAIGLDGWVLINGHWIPSNLTALLLIAMCHVESVHNSLDQ